MKYFFSVLFLFSISLSISAQTFAPAGAKWQYTYSEYLADGYIEYRYTHDSIINGQLTQALLRTEYMYKWPGVLDTISSGFEYVYSDSNKVYNYRYGKFYVLYDFNAQPGDWWIISGFDPLMGCDSTGKVKVDSIDFVITNSDTLKRMYLSPKDSSHWAFTGPVIEKVGCTSYMFPIVIYFCGAVYEAYYGPLRCYQDDAFGVYDAGVVDSCNHIDVLSIEDNPPDVLNVSIFPNPTSGQINLNTTKRIEKIELYNCVGDLIRQFESDNSVYVGNMRNGLYILILTSVDGSMIVKKLIINSY